MIVKMNVKKKVKILKEKELMLWNYYINVNNIVKKRNNNNKC